MILENKNKAGNIKFIFMIIPVIFTAAMLTLIFLDIPKGYWYVAALAAAMVIVFILLSLLQYNYIYCEINPKKILFRFHGIGPLNKEYKTYKINPQLFVTHKIKTSMYGYVPKLYLFVKMNNEIAKYPPISLTGLNPEETKQLQKALMLIEKINKSNHKL